MNPPLKCPSCGVEFDWKAVIFGFLGEDDSDWEGDCHKCGLPLVFKTRSTKTYTVEVRKK